MCFQRQTGLDNFYIIFFYGSRDSEAESSDIEMVSDQVSVHTRTCLSKHTYFLSFNFFEMVTRNLSIMMRGWN